MFYILMSGVVCHYDTLLPPSTSAMTDGPGEVLVLGAGVIGLTAAIVTAEAGHRVTVWAADPPLETTSRVAGAIWKPYLSAGPQVAGWAATTFGVLSEHATLSGTGVRLLPLLEATEARAAALPDWARVGGARHLGSQELLPGWTGGFRCVVPVVDMGRYLPYLEQRLAVAGGTIETRRVSSFSTIGSWGAVVNCTGLGARALTDDQSLSPVRGQIVVLTNPGIDHCIGHAGPDGVETYVITHADTVVVGGTADPDQWSLEPEPATAEAMLGRARRLVPELADPTVGVVAHRVGLRPYRPTVRLEVDPRPPAGIGRLVHNYGHGGSGVTLSWGCATAAAGLLG